MAILTLTRAGRRLQRRAFTLVEAVSVLTVIGILATAVALTFGAVSAGQADLAGGPVLGSAQLQARKIAAVDSYRWAFDRGAPTPSAAFAAALGQAAGPADLTFTAGPSTAADQVSAAWVSQTQVAFAVQTGPGRCLLLVDTLTSGSSWARATDVAAGGCSAAVAVATLRDCPQAIAGTDVSPSRIDLSRPCTPPPA